MPVIGVNYTGARGFEPSRFFGRISEVTTWVCSSYSRPCHLGAGTPHHWPRPPPATRAGARARPLRRTRATGPLSGARSAAKSGAARRR